MKRHLGIILLLASVAALLFGILQLFSLRFQAGDVYPEYSSLRTDPLGVMAFYESLARLSGVKVSRDFSTVSRLPDTKGTAYFEVAVPLNALQAFPEETFRKMERFVNGGGRLVITIYPVGARTNRSGGNASQSERPKDRPYGNWWGVDYDIIDLDPTDNSYEPSIVRNVSGLALPETLAWHSGIVFRNLSPEWKPIYMRDAHPVMIQRSFGQGAAIIATDSYLLSNEAMALDRHSDLLAFLTGPSWNVVFSEAHLGITENPGVATLLRRYRLHGVAASLILVAVLYIWQMSMPLVPRNSGKKTSGYIEGKGAAGGFINLLRRSIPSGDLLEICFNEWKKSVPHSGTYSTARIEQAEAAFLAEQSLPAKQRDALAAYRTISKTLQRRIQ